MKQTMAIFLSLLVILTIGAGNSASPVEGKTQSIPPSDVVTKVKAQKETKTNVTQKTTVHDTTFVPKPQKGVPTNSGPVLKSTYPAGCECYGATTKNPIRIKSNHIDLYGVPLDYGFVKSRFVLLRRPGLHYYQQNAETSFVDMVSAKVVSTITSGVSSYILGKGISKIPYMARLFDAMGKTKPYNFGDYAKTVAGYLVERKIPFWGRIISAPVPTYGTKQVLIYVSKTGKDYSWNRRVLFEIKKNGEITYTKWYVK